MGAPYVLAPWALCAQDHNNKDNIVRNLKRALRPIGEPLDDEIQGEDPIPMLEDREALGQAFGGLNDRQTAILQGVAFGVAIPAIAVELGIAVKTTEKTLRRTRLALKARRDREK